MADVSDLSTEDGRIAEQRRAIDAIDDQILDLLSQRGVVSQRIAEIKLESGPDAQLYRPEREARLLRRIADENTGSMPDVAVQRVFREIMSACLALERPLSVAWLGPNGTFTQEAAYKHFGEAIIDRPQLTIDDVFAAVESREADFGLVPVENSTEGIVNHTLDNFLASSLSICGEVENEVRLHFFARPDAQIENLKCVCGHQQALAQCRIWLRKHYAHLKQIALPSNGEAARQASELAGYAAVAGSFTERHYELKAIARNIQDAPGNTTRFLLIGQTSPSVSGDDKTSIIVSARNRPGALFELLEPFYRENISLTRIDTRPSRTEKWTYVFFIEFQGHEEDEKVAQALREVEKRSALLKRLGSYPRAVL